jgi:transcription antitermination factor NusG
MKTAGWIFVVIGVLAFLGAASKGDSVFGPLFWIGIGIVLLYLKREKEENNKEKTIAGTTTPKKTEALKVEEKESEVTNVEQNSPVTFEQKEAALCLIAFFAGYNEDIMTNDAAYMISSQSAIFFEMGDYKGALTTALPKYQDADKMIDTVLTIKDKDSKEFILLTCYDLVKMSGKPEAYEFLYNIANEMGITGIN